MSAICIESIEQFKNEAFVENGDFVDVFVLLAGGIARSSKRISYRPDGKEFLIINEIDDSYQEVAEENLATETNLVEAISKNCLFKY